MKTSELFKKIPTPKILYHYTSSTGLLGILTSKSVWGTHVNYLNDAQDFIYISRFLQKIMHEEKQP